MSKSICSIFLLFLLFSCIDSIDHGKELYETQCSNCHGDEGKGLGKLIPPINNTNRLREIYNQLPSIILNGVEGKLKINGIEYNSTMPGVPHLTETELANLINYINKKWGDGKQLTPAKLEELL